MVKNPQLYFLEQLSKMRPWSFAPCSQSDSAKDLSIRLAQRTKWDQSWPTCGPSIVSHRQQCTDSHWRMWRLAGRLVWRSQWTFPLQLPHPSSQALAVSLIETCKVMARLSRLERLYAASLNSYAFCEEISVSLQYGPYCKLCLDTWKVLTPGWRK